MRRGSTARSRAVFAGYTVHDAAELIQIQDPVVIHVESENQTHLGLPTSTPRTAWRHGTSLCHATGTARYRSIPDSG